MSLNSHFITSFIPKRSLTDVYPISFTLNGECAICYELKDETTDKCKILFMSGVKLVCKHAFCQECFDQLTKCVICRTPINKEDFE